MHDQDRHQEKRRYPVELKRPAEPSARTGTVSLDSPDLGANFGLANLARGGMAEIVNMHQAKSSLSRLVERALAGEEIVIARNAEPLVKLVPVQESASRASRDTTRDRSGSPPTVSLR